MTATATRRPANVALWVLQVGLAGFYALGAVPKVLGDPTVLAGFAAIGVSPTGALVIGLLELAGAVGLLVPRLCGLAALGFVGLMAGAVAFTVPALGAAAAALPAVLLVLVGLLAWARWDRTAALVALVRR